MIVLVVTFRFQLRLAFNLFYYIMLDMILSSQYCSSSMHLGVAIAGSWPQSWRKLQSHYKTTKKSSLQRWWAILRLMLNCIFLCFLFVVWYDLAHTRHYLSLIPFGFLRMALQTISLPTWRWRDIPRSTSTRQPVTFITTMAEERPRTSSVSSRRAGGPELVPWTKWRRRVLVLWKMALHLHRRQSFRKTNSDRGVICSYAVREWGTYRDSEKIASYKLGTICHKSLLH